MRLLTCFACAQDGKQCDLFEYLHGQGWDSDSVCDIADVANELGNNIDNKYLIERRSEYADFMDEIACAVCGSLMRVSFRMQCVGARAACAYKLRVCVNCCNLNTDKCQLMCPDHKQPFVPVGTIVLEHMTTEILRAVSILCGVCVCVCVCV